MTALSYLSLLRGTKSYLRKNSRSYSSFLIPKDSLLGLQGLNILMVYPLVHYRLPQDFSEKNSVCEQSVENILLQTFDILIGLQIRGR